MSYARGNPPPMGASTYPTKTFTDLKAVKFTADNTVIDIDTVNNLTVENTTAKDVVVTNSILINKKSTGVQCINSVPQAVTLDSPGGILTIGGDGEFNLPGGKYVSFELSNSFIELDSNIQISLYTYVPYFNPVTEATDLTAGVPVVGFGGLASKGVIVVTIMNPYTTPVSGIMQLSFLIT